MKEEFYNKSSYQEIIEYCESNNIPIYSNNKIKEWDKTRINYFFGIPGELMENKNYNQIIDLIPEAKKSQLEKDIDSELEYLIGL